MEKLKESQKINVECPSCNNLHILNRCPKCGQRIYKLDLGKTEQRCSDCNLPLFKSDHGHPEVKCTECKELIDITGKGFSQPFLKTWRFYKVPIIGVMVLVPLVILILWMVSLLQESQRVFNLQSSIGFYQEEKYKYLIRSLETDLLSDYSEYEQGFISRMKEEIGEPQGFFDVRNRKSELLGYYFRRNKSFLKAFQMCGSELCGMETLREQGHYLWHVRNIERQLRGLYDLRYGNYDSIELTMKYDNVKLFIDEAFKNMEVAFEGARDQTYKDQ